jgi:ABC-type transport system involved in multi-copper enzyme maturation permease subunit
MTTTKYNFPLLWKAWRESRIRFFILLAALIFIVAYIVLTGSAFVKGYAKLHPDESMDFNEYVWQALFNYYFQGLWIGAIIILALGGLLREYDLGISMFTLSLPVSRNNLIKTRFLLGIVEAFTLGIIPSLLIPLFSIWIGFNYPLFDAACFGFLMTTAGMVIFSFTISLSCVFSGELTAFLISIVSVGTLFFIMKAKSIHQWSLFDVMNGAKSINPKTHLIAYPLPWMALCICIIITITFYVVAVKLIETRDL